MELPTRHVLAGVNRQHLNKDFEKNTISRLYYPDEEKLEMASRALEHVLKKYFIGQSKIMTFEEAVDLHMELSKSPGYPWNTLAQTKREIIEKYREICHEIIQRIGDGEDIDVYWQTSPKVEILSREKIEVKGKQRTFMCCDIIAYIVGLMLYGHQNESLLRMATSNDWGAVGISPFHGGWNTLAQQLTRGDPERPIIAFDIAQMEASITPKWFEIMYGIRNPYLEYQPEDEKRVKNLTMWYFKQLVYSLVLDPNGILGIMIGVNPSGQLNTLMDNTIGCMLLAFYCLARQVKTLSDLLLLIEATYGKVMGDDTIVQLNSYTANIPKYSKEVGFTMTIENQGTIKDVTFLNFGFVYVEEMGMYIFRPNFDKLMASILYYFKSKSWRLTLAKLYSIRILFYPYKQYLNYVDKFIAYVLNKHDATLRGEKNMDEKITYAQLANLSMSTDDIRFLIYGCESF